MRVVQTRKGEGRVGRSQTVRKVKRKVRNSLP